MSTRVVAPPVATTRKKEFEDPKARAAYVKKFLPTDDADDPSTPRTRSRSRPVRTFVKIGFYKLILWVLYSITSLYFRARFVYNFILNRWFSVLYYHHKTPELIQKDVKQLDRLPQHVSVILEFEKEGGVEQLIDHVAEISCWCASAGIPTLSVYEQTGTLKKYISTSHRITSQRLHSYFGKKRPTLRVLAPHLPSYTNGDTEDLPDGESPDLEVIFISSEDGRESIVDLTKTLCEMAIRGKMTKDDVTAELIEAELESLTIPEPDLLILFSPSVKLLGYPPWQIRLTEIFHLPDNDAVGYQVFLRALYNYAKCEMRFGR
ncbi:hypothetical protein TWF788_004909 [Orbilia oligospora]|uniref:ditrans,polycis-polyprenyl diphosphate synthase [(2E,6E)-farnesyldiphosphate specific] n=1 Tax=Orbilia oligospora TaxID=2813651 RepID=A0A6G1MAG7_ORBOL|nr:hypothetical protein TWF788_004909 [Orbilia oligospora]KAF3217520.1 hypothetical protein TWF191_008496 [Orbilia oligospora]KAF3251781.1 hypothetical protein TWF192_004738 [Orbilia oligospora]